MADDIAVKVECVSKNFVLPHEKVTSIKSAFTSLANLGNNKTKETQHALKEISFEIKKGEFFGIVGRNGSGKSTLLKILAGIYQPTIGKVSTYGKLVPFIELGVGFNPELTGRENVYLNGAMLGFSEPEVTAMYDNIVEFAELKPFMDQKLKNYSSGMQVRLAFSMATRSEADILLIDEVLAVGDADFQRKCFDYFRKLKKDKKTVVFVSHDMEAVREYCDRALLINDSELVMSGTPEKIAEEYIKLFNPTDDKAMENQSAEASRWGDEAAIYKAVKVSVEGNEVCVTATIRANAKMQKPILGVQIRNSADQLICGINTKLLHIDNLILEPGDERRLLWRIPNILSDGNYQVDLALTHADGVTQADWWHAAAGFKVVKSISTPHLVSPDITLTLS